MYFRNKYLAFGWCRSKMRLYGLFTLISIWSVRKNVPESLSIAQESEMIFLSNYIYFRQIVFFFLFLGQRKVKKYGKGFGKGFGKFGKGYGGFGKGFGGGFGKGFGGGFGKGFGGGFGKGISSIGSIGSFGGTSFGHPGSFGTFGGYSDFGGIGYSDGFGLGGGFGGIMDPYPFNDFGGFGGGFGTVAPGKSIYMSLAQSFLCDQRRSKVRLRIHQTFSRTSIVFFAKFANWNVTQLPTG